MFEIDLGLALIEMEETHRVALNSDFDIISDIWEIEKSLGPCGSSNFLDFIYPRDREMVSSTAEGLKQDGVASGIYLTALGSPVELIIARRCDNGYDIYYKNIEQRMRSLERLSIFYRNFRKSPTPICFTDSDANIVDANRAFLDFYGYRLDEVRGKNPRVLKSGKQTPAAYKEMWGQISDPENGSWTGEVINRKSTGEEVIVLLTVTAVRRSNGTLVGYIASANDITRKKQLEEQLVSYNEQLLEAGRMKTELMSITSHDLKAPLNSIINLASIIKDKASDIKPDQLVEYLDKIMSNGHRLTEFINDILDLDKMESGRMSLNTRRVRLDSVLKSCIETNSINATTKGVKINFSVQGNPEPVVADTMKMEQVFNNILSNAVKFSPAGSEISVIYKDNGKGQPKTVGISDRGAGIPEADLELIFDRYYQVKKDGAVSKRGFGVGLGLNIVKGIVELHGGSICAANNPDGAGCVFTVEIPGRSSITTGRDIAAIVHDPTAVVYSQIEHLLNSREVSCYTTKNIHELRRVIDYERPRMLFVHLESADTELTNYLTALTDIAEKPMIISVSDSGLINDSAPPFDHSMTLPVADVEVFGLLKELQFRG